MQEALTGRIELLRLWPLAQAELEHGSRNLVDSLFGGDPPRVRNAPIGRAAFARRVAAGGYPEAQARDGRRRDRWFASHLTTTFERDIRALADLQKGHEMRRLLSVLATRSANLLRYASIASTLLAALGFSPPTRRAAATARLATVASWRAWRAARTP